MGQAGGKQQAEVQKARKPVGVSLRILREVSFLS